MKNFKQNVIYPKGFACRYLNIELHLLSHKNWMLLIGFVIFPKTNYNIIGDVFEMLIGKPQFIRW